MKSARDLEIDIPRIQQRQAHLAQGIPACARNLAQPARIVRNAFCSFWLRESTWPQSKVQNPACKVQTAAPA